MDRPPPPTGWQFLAKLFHFWRCQCPQLLEQAPLAIGEPFRHVNLDPDIEIAACTAAKARQPLFAQAHIESG